jgi:fatty acid desaturase
MQALFLNYNLHLAHHREPAVPWIHLPGRVRPADASPSFWSVYRRLWQGAQPAPAAGPGRAPEAVHDPEERRP